MSVSPQTPFHTEPSMSPILVQLLKGIVYRDTHARLWSDLTRFDAAIMDYLRVIGLQLVVNNNEGYAYLRQRPEVADQTMLDQPQDQIEIPKLIQRRPLSYHVSLLCILLRKKLAESDYSGEDLKVVVNRDDVVNMMLVFMPEQANEAKLIEQVDGHIRKVVELGFLKKLKEKDHYEIRRIIKSLVDAEWLADLNEKLAEYRQYAINNL